MNFKKWNFTTDNQVGVVIEIELVEGEIFTPEQLAHLKPPHLNGMRGVVISGNAPTWLYAYLVYWYHTTHWVGVFDPHLGGAVVVARNHHTAPDIGDVVKIPQPHTIQL
jgi:CRISPR-associated Csx3 family protein